jgi:hypothetical protein
MFLPHTRRQVEKPLRRPFLFFTGHTASLESSDATITGEMILSWLSLYHAWPWPTPFSKHIWWPGGHRAQGCSYSMCLTPWGYYWAEKSKKTLVRRLRVLVSPEQRTKQRHRLQNNSKTLLKGKERKSKPKAKESTASKAVVPCPMARRHWLAKL